MSNSDPNPQSVPGAPALVPRRVRIQTAQQPDPGSAWSNGARREVAQEVVFDIRDVSVSYGSKQALEGVNLRIYRNQDSPL